jgi:hypothetical protein
MYANHLIIKLNILSFSLDVVCRSVLAFFGYNVWIYKVLPIPSFLEVLTHSFIYIVLISLLCKYVTLKAGCI